MKTLRKYIQTLLCETMHPKIKSQYDRLNAEGYLIAITKSDKPSVQLLKVKPKTMDSNHGYVEAAYKSTKNDPGPCNNAAIIGGGFGIGAFAYSGFGPLLYDILFEVANLEGYTGIGPDVSDVSDDAFNVWQYYLDNRPDVVVKQRDLTQFPRTKKLTDDCTDNEGYSASAGHFPGGRAKAYKEFEEQRNYYGEFEFLSNPTDSLSEDFIDYWFDPTNPLSKTYHKTEGQTPIIDKLREDLLLHPDTAINLQIPYNEAELITVWKKSPYYHSWNWPEKYNFSVEMNI